MQMYDLHELVNNIENTYESAIICEQQEQQSKKK